MAKNLYDAVMERLQWDEEQEVKNAVAAANKRLQFPALDVKELESGINAMLCAERTRND